MQGRGAACGSGGTTDGTLRQSAYRAPSLLRPRSWRAGRHSRWWARRKGPAARRCRSPSRKRGRRVPPARGSA